MGGGLELLVYEITTKYCIVCSLVKSNFDILDSAVGPSPVKILCSFRPNVDGNIFAQCAVSPQRTTCLAQRFVTAKKVLYVGGFCYTLDKYSHLRLFCAFYFKTLLPVYSLVVSTGLFWFYFVSFCTME